MATTADALFREKPVGELRDYRLQLSHDIAKAKDRFETELGRRYTDLLAVTDQVDELLQQARVADADLMELCFNDAKFKLEALPDPGASNGPAATAAGQELSPSAGLDLDGANLTLTVSEWALAVKNFVREPASQKHFDSLVQSFHAVLGLCDVSRYASVLARNCSVLEDAVLEQQPQFSAPQWVKLHRLVHSHAEVFPFKRVTELDALVFGFLLANEESLRSAGADPDVEQFLEGEAFKQKFVERALLDVDAEFQAFEEAAAGSAPLPELYGLEFDDRSLPALVTKASLYCSGVTSLRDRALYTLADNTVALVRKLQRSQADTAVISRVKERLSEVLNERRKEVIETSRCAEPEVLQMKDKTESKLSQEDEPDSKLQRRELAVAVESVSSGTQTASTDAEPEAPTVEPEASTAEPEASTAEPEAPTVESEAPTVEPEAPTVEPEAPTVEPEAPTTENDNYQKHAPNGSSEPQPVASLPSSRDIVQAAVQRLNTDNLLAYLGGQIELVDSF
ncbi:LAQU0S14e02322g1_1 [Lachancea quebecensis]|uniref:LAQU0S14e02322g1_1 n=1 Tax=Lachancea quebecensis TaxID=1654605 RepID=A0A0P1L3I1_9SACH|nr:LAQU0S14e02322g1_1 [Lachancea quebecensis]